MTRSRAQLEASAAHFLRQAYGTGSDDATAILFAKAMMGAEHAALIQRVWQRYFKAMEP